MNILGPLADTCFSSLKNCSGVINGVGKGFAGAFSMFKR